jgi:hypothetical protein
MKKISTRMSEEAHTVYTERRILDRERTTVRHEARASKFNARARFGGVN